MPLPVWICLLFVLLSLTVGIAWIFRAGLRVWRALKIFGRALDATAGGLARALERLAEQSAAFGAGFPRLQAAIARFQASLARFAVLRAAVQDVQDAVGRVTALYPSK